MINSGITPAGDVMTVSNRKIRVILSSLLSTWLICTPAWADDTEIYFGGSNSSTLKPNVMFILDTSGSMGEKDGGNISRMDRMKQALTHVLNNAEDINVGLMRFTNPGGPVLYPVRDIDQVLTGATTNALITGNVDVSISSGNNDAEQLADGSVRLNSTLLEILNPGSTSISRTISHPNDDAEQPIGSKANLDSPDLEMMYEGNTEQVIGLRFRLVDIPQGASISNAYLTFSVKDHYDGALSASIFGEDTDNAGVFKNKRNNLTQRSKTSARVDWDIAAANAPAAGQQMQSVDISSIVQEIVNRGGWVANNKMAFIIERISGSSSDKRQFHSYDSTVNNDQRPQLTIEYSTGSGSGESQTVGLRFNNVGVPQGATITSARLKLSAGNTNAESASLLFRGELAGHSDLFDANANNLSGRTSTTNSVGWMGTPAWSDGSTYTSPELLTIAQEIVNLPGWCGGNSMTFFVEGNAQRIAHAFENDVDKAAKLEISYDIDSVAEGACIYQPYSYNILADSDDAEQASSSMQLSSSDLDLGENIVGLRYRSIPLAPNTTLSNAYIEFTADAANSGSSSLTIQGHLNANPTTFTTGSNNISNRTPTNASVSWAPETWNQAGDTIQSPNIASIINELTAQTGWTSGNAMAFIIEGSGHRRSESYDSSNLPPRLMLYAKPNDVTTTSATVRSEMIDAVQSLPDDGWTPIVDTLYEAARYYRGEPVDYGRTRGTGGNKHLKRISHPDSYAGGLVVYPDGCTAENPGSGDCAGESLVDQADSVPTYITPITEDCQANYIVLLTDGFANHNNSIQKIKALTGETRCVGNDDNEECGIELANFLHTQDQLSRAQDQTIKTYTIGLEFETAWLTSLAEAGGGAFFQAESASDLTSVFDTIIKTIKAVNTTFVQPSVTINQFNRFSHRDDVYFSLFKPQETAKWYGNLKKYQLKGSPATLYDNRSPQQPAIDPLTGFFGIDSQSFWSVDEDGNAVEKGGAASKIPVTRHLYTNVSGAELSVSANAFHESNPLISKDSDLLDIAAKSDAYRSDLLQWARGLDANGAQRFELGDPLHSRPELVTYDGLSDPPASSIFVGTNEGFLHAIDINTGIEQFAFIPKELLRNLDTYYVNASTPSRPYGLDGGITLWTKDANKDGDLQDSGDFAYLYIGMRRGGRNYYALDVTDVNHPRVMWQITGGSPGFEALGQTWSQPVKSKVIFDNVKYEVLIFGGGYDVSQDDASVRTADALGNAVYIVDAITGALIWSAGNDSTNNGSHNESHADMNYSIPSQVRVIDMNQDGIADQLYVGDMGGQLWRFDIYNTDNDNQLNQSVDITKLASLGGSDEASNRRFYYPPDLALAVDGKQRYLSLAIGSGFRAHPLNTAIDDRFYMIKQLATHAKPTRWTTLTETDLYDATDNHIGGNDAALQASAQVALSNSDVDRKEGWYLRMQDSGEKVLSGSTTIQNQIVFTSYAPTAATEGSCNPNQGTSRAYLVSLFDATPLKDINEDGSITAADRVIQLQIGSIPATPTVIDTLDSKPTVWIGPERLDQVDTDVESTRTYWIEESY
ncbi:MAG: type IV pilus assembly protein PilY1 [Motiliproteus sp.]|jgi:type IV pilus assembly protein PilY1